MRLVDLLPVALLVACGSGTEPTPSTGTTDSGLTTESTTTFVDTGFLPMDEGSIMLVRRLTGGQRTTELFGLFVDEHAGYRNLAQCAIKAGYCFDYLPAAEDDWVDIDRERLFEPGFSEFRYVGLEIGLGPFTAPYTTGDLYPHYYADLTKQVGPEGVRGALGVTFGGQWGDYVGTADIVVSPDLELITPKPNAKVEFHDGENLLVEWVPDGNGIVLLTLIETGRNASYARMYELEDDGYFSLPVVDLGLGTDDMSFDMKLTRWNWGEAKHWGNTVEVVATSEVGWTADYVYTEGRDYIEPEDKCLPASTMPSLTSGAYWGNLDGYSDDFDSTSYCTDGFNANGKEGFLRVQLEPLEFLSATSTLLTEDASIYVVEDCADEDTCLNGSDENEGPLPESVSFFNNTDQQRTVYLVVDGRNNDSKGMFHLDVLVDALLEPNLNDTCATVDFSNPTGSGTYYTSYLPYSGGLDPTVGGCTGTSLPGPDASTPITLLSGQTLTATITMQGGDPALYLLYNCNNALSCPDGADNSVGENELLVYTNTSGASENLSLVVDTRGPTLLPFFLTVSIQ